MEGGEVFQLMKFSRCDVCCIKGGLDMFRPSKSLSECLLAMCREFHSVFQQFPKPSIVLEHTNKTEQKEQPVNNSKNSACEKTTQHDSIFTRFKV